MVRYRRSRIPGGTYFFTLTLRDRRDDALVRHIDLLRASWRVASSRVPHEVIAVVVLPEHLHAVIRLRNDTADYSQLWQEIKKGFTRRLPGDRVSLWQPRFWEHTIRDEVDLRRHVDYVHFNPVKHGLVTRVADWPLSSFHRHARMGWLPVDWGGEAR
ncbi:transposase [Lysobacter panacisoli]|uniref:Transposase n=2 Tax=Lysobacter panacisoli TaxID=1255263 RepID=A0ABP9L5Q3_9GAMM